MANYKIFSIGKANLEIDRLETELAKAQAELATAKENEAAIAGDAEKVSAALKESMAELASRQASITSLTTERDRIAGELKAANDKLANPSQQIKEAGSREALKITQGQGQSPVTSTSTSETSTGDILAQYDAISDPTDKVVFYRKHKDAINAAWRPRETKR